MIKKVFASNKKISLISLVFIIILGLVISKKSIAQEYRNDSLGININFIKESGFTDITEAEFCSYIHYGFRTINGYQINRHFFLGLGLGINKQTYTIWHTHFLNLYYTYYDMNIAPIYIDFRYDLRRYSHSFFAFADLGYSKLLSTNPTPGYYSYLASSNPISYAVSIDQDTYSGGLMYGFGIGYKYYISPNTSLMICLSANILGIIHNNTLIEYTTGVNAVNYPNITYNETIGDYPALCIGFTFR